MSATEPTRNNWDSGDDGLWADAAASGDAESAPNDSEKGAGHVNNTGFTSGRANYLWAMVGEWFQRIRDTLLPEHTNSGGHWEVDITGASLSPKLTVTANASDLAATRLITANNHVPAEVFYVTRDGHAFGVQVAQTDTTQRVEVVPGLVGTLISSGTRAEAAISLGYAENDATVRKIRFWAPKMPEWCTLVSVTVVIYAGHTDNSFGASLYSTSNAVDSSKASRGSASTLTGVTGDQSMAISPSGTLTQAGAFGWFVEVSITNNNALSGYVSKVLFTTTVGRL